MSMQLVPTENQINAIAFMAKQATASKFYQTLGGEAGIMSIMLLARELDIPPMQALSGGIWNIQGKVEMSARMMNMKIRQAGHTLDVNCDSTQCTITGTRKDTGEKMTVKFSIDDATRAGLASRDVWKKNPDDMLFARCLSKLARRLFPDVIGNCYVEGEIKESLEEPIERKKVYKTNELDIPYFEIKPNEESLENPVVYEQEDLPIEEGNQNSSEKISNEQLVTLCDLFIGQENRMIDFLAHYKIAKLEDLAAIHYHDAIFVLQSKKKKTKS